ncbi:hypothetical protein M9Y10_033582 [Tritrichomonas musculus]|uniref:Myb-like DNA-binding domain containing protein n=1 Tax=Tritrichomonas musculus TaxID=1915356 RepID=A0ABR2KEI2_9EUKA
MYTVTKADQQLDPFALSRRPLHILNCNNNSNFQQTNTRIPSPQVIFEDRKSYAENVNGFAIKEKIAEGQTVSPNNDEEIYSDNFNRDFIPFNLPDPIGKVAPFITVKDESKRKPYWMLDLPSSQMHIEPKLYYAAALNPTLDKTLPCCDMCKCQLQYPFFASLNFNLCPKCLSTGHIPLNTTSIEFMPVEDPRTSTGTWTLEETNALLSIIEEEGDDWQKISQRLKTHSPAECLIHFMRLPMYDQYYIADPLLVPEANFSDDKESNNNIPSDPNILPFMIAPDPIAAYVEFLHILNKRLGNKIAELSQRQIEQILSSKSGVMVFNSVSEIMKNLLKSTGEEAGKIAEDDFESMMNSFRLSIRLLEKERNNLSQIVKSGFKEFQSISESISSLINQE